VDLSHVEFLSSVGFRPLLRLNKQIREQGGGRLIVCAMQPGVRDVMHATRLVTSSGSTQAPFDEQPTVDAAVASLTAAKT
jgi:anti-anti-sigma regulatory factor